MANELAQLLLDERAVTPEELDEAIRWQVVHGGSLDTALLELKASNEAELLSALSRSLQLPVADKSKIDAIEPHLPRLFPLVFAETYRLVPYRLEGASLGVLVNGPVDRELYERIYERLKLRVAPAVTTEARMHYAMHRLYGVELLPRFRALLERLDEATPTPLWGPAPAEHVLSWGLSTTRIAPTRARGDDGQARPDVAGLLARIDSATDRDALVEILLEIALGTFDYVALFLVHGDHINGWRSTDPEATRRVARISVPVELPSVFQTIYATGGHYLGPLPANTYNQAILKELGRESPRAALLAPIQVGGKIAVILYADNGARIVPSKRVSGVLLLAQRMGLCLENLIRRRKAARGASTGTSATQAGPLPALERTTTADHGQTALIQPPKLQPRAPSIRVDDSAAPEHQTPAPAFEPARTEPARPAPVHAAPQAPGSEPESDSESASADDSWESVSIEPHESLAPVLAKALALPAIEIEVDVPESAPTSAASAAASYVAFSDVDESPQEAMSDWEDVLVDTMASAAQPADVVRPKVEVAAVPAVTWEDVINEARSAPSLTRAAAHQERVEVAGTVVDERELVLDNLEAQDPGARRAALERGLALGNGLDELLRTRFPGRLTWNPFTAETPRPRFPELSGLCALLAARNESATAIVLPHLESDDRTKRFAAIAFLHDLPNLTTTEALARRLYDTEPKNRLLAIDALRAHVHTPAYGRVLQSLREQLKVPVYEVQVTTVQVLGQLRDPRAVPSLIPLVVSPQPELAQATASALAVICAQSFGRDVARWAEWWQKNYNLPREAWLVHGLRNPSVAIQQIAFDELVTLTRYNGSFDPRGPAEQKEAVIRVWEQWLRQLGSTPARTAQST